MPDGFIGVEIGGTKLQIVTGTAEGAILNRFRATVHKQEGGGGIRAQIQLGLSKLLEKKTKIKRIGVGFGGPVDWRTGQVACSHQIPGWEDFNIVNWLQNATGIPAIADNDANVAALGEAMRGAGQRKDPVFYVTLGSGVGGGLVSDRRIYHGMQPGESEIGHVRLDRSGITVEDRCSGWAADKRVREVINQSPKGKLASLADGVTSGEARFLGDALKAGDKAAERILAELTEDLAFGLSHAVHLFHPEIIVLGGGLSNLGKPLQQGVQSHLERFTMEAFRPAPRVVIAGLRDDAVPIGALLLAGSVPRR